jgi:transcriptional regulator with XRE-family HTH domain
MFQNLGVAISVLRERKGENQRQLAEAAGVGKSQLSKYESGQELPRLDSLARLLEALGVGYDSFFSTLALIDWAMSGQTRDSLPLLPGLALEDTDQAFSELLRAVMVLHHACVNNRILLDLKGREHGEPGPGS